MSIHHHLAQFVCWTILVREDSKTRVFVVEWPFTSYKGADQECRYRNAFTSYQGMNGFMLWVLVESGIHYPFLPNLVKYTITH